MPDRSPNHLRTAVILTAIVTAVLTTALLDRSCQRGPEAPGPGPSRSLAPR